MEDLKLKLRIIREQLEQDLNTKGKIYLYFATIVKLKLYFFLLFVEFHWKL